VGRTEYHNDPDASAPHAIVVAATAFVVETDGRMLLVQRADTGRWVLPGGALEVGERIVDTAVRETRLATGIDILVTGLIGVYSTPRRATSCADGETRQQFSLCFRAHPLGGVPAPSVGSLDVRWIEPAELGDLHVDPETLLRIGHGLSDRTLPYLC
jgi:ADP-ribose pyrophosphatase YjhB (NUDIX family)